MYNLLIEDENDVKEFEEQTRYTLNKPKTSSTWLGNLKGKYTSKYNSNPRLPKLPSNLI